MEIKSKKKKKHFRPSVMEFWFGGKLSKSMWEKAKQKADNFFNSDSDYMRSLLKKDLNVDDYGNELK